MSEPNPKVDAYLARQTRWQPEMSRLRALLLAMPLTEDLKWGEPCYTLAGKNVVLIHGFKDYCALLFMKGALLADPENLLIQQTENVQSARQIRFTNLDQITMREATLRAYVQNAIAVEASGAKVDMAQSRSLTLPEEFITRLEDLPDLRPAFEALTPGRQRAYALHFSGAKLSKTRSERVEKAIPRILSGKGLDD